MRNEGLDGREGGDGDGDGGGDGGLERSVFDVDGGEDGFEVGLRVEERGGDLADDSGAAGGGRALIGVDEIFDEREIGLDLIGDELDLRVRSSAGLAFAFRGGDDTGDVERDLSDDGQVGERDFDPGSAASGDEERGGERDAERRFGDASFH